MSFFRSFLKTFYYNIKYEYEKKMKGFHVNHSNCLVTKNVATTVSHYYGHIQETILVLLLWNSTFFLCMNMILWKQLNFT